VHRRGPGVIRESPQRDVVMMDPDDAFDDADIDAALIQDAALLDVQLDVRRDRPRCVTRLGNSRRVSADATDLVRQRHAVAPRPNDLVARQVSNKAAAAGEAALFVAPDHDLEGMAVLVATRGQRVRDLDGGARPDIAIIVAAFGHRIDMRAEQDGWRASTRSGPAPPPYADDVADRIDAGAEPGVAHQVHHEAPASDIGVAERDAADSTLGIAAELGEIGEMLIHARAVHAPGLPSPLPGARRQGDKGLDEVAALHLKSPYRSPF